MLLLSFHIGAESYAVTATQIVEVLPLTTVKRIPQAPAFVAGLLDYRGTPVPVIDLCQLSEGRCHNKVLSSRIILVNYENGHQESHILGLIAEKVTETLNPAAGDFNPTGIKVREAPYLGEVINKNGHMIQLIEIGMLLPVGVQTLLFQESTPKQQAKA